MSEGSTPAARAPGRRGISGPGGPGALDRLAARWARSPWTLALDLAMLAAALVPLYLLRGTRLVLLAVGGGVALAGAAVAFARPWPLLAAAVFSLFSEIDPLVPVPLSIGFLGLLAVRLLYDALSGTRLDGGSWWHRIALAALLVSCLTSLVGARDFAAAGTEFQQIATGLVLFFAVTTYVDRLARARALAVVFVTALTLSVVIEFLQVGLAGGLVLAALGQARIHAGAAEANVSAAHLDTAVPLALYLAVWLRGRRRLWFALATLLLVVAVVLSSSRAGLLVLGLLLAACFLCERRLHRHALWLVGALAATAAILPPQYWVRFVSIGQVGGIVVDRSLQLRQHAMAASWDLVRAHPWFGVGLGNVPAHTPRAMMMPMMAHNTPLEVAASVGLVGFAAYAAWVGLGLWAALQNRARAARRGGSPSPPRWLSRSRPRSWRTDSWR